MTGDDGLRSELEALERAAPVTDAVPRVTRKPALWLRAGLLGATVVAAVLLTTLTVGPHDSNTGIAPSPDSSASADSRLCRDSVIDRTGGYVTRFELEDELVVLEAAVRDRPEFGGIYLSDEKGAWSGLEIVVLTTDCGIEDHIAEIDHPNRIRIMLVEHAYGQLLELYEAISDAKLADHPATAGMSGVGLDVTGNTVEVRFLDDTPAGRLVAAGGIPPAFADAFGTDAMTFDVISRDELPQLLLPLPDQPRPSPRVMLP